MHVSYIARLGKDILVPRAFTQQQDHLDDIVSGQVRHKYNNMCALVRKHGNHHHTDRRHAPRANQHYAPRHVPQTRRG